MHALFATTAITSAVLIVAVLIVVPESPLRTGGRFDVTGAVILASVLVGLLLAITKGQDWGWTSLRTLGCVAASLALLALWIPLQLRGSAPLVDLRSTRRKPVALAHVCSFLVGLVFFANLLSSTMLLEQPVATGYGLGMTASQTGLLLIPAALSMALMAPVAGMIVRRFGPRTALITSTVALTVAYLARSVMLDSAIQVVIATMAVTMTVVVGYSALPILIMTSVPPSETAVANSVNALARSIASAVASATVAAIVVSITIEVDGHTYPSENAFHLLFLGAAAFGMLATVAAVALPHRHRRSA
jgi:predicted MFS family arabinose efflux permease